ncbi:unnamed protein product [Oppiella nova]|uniref:Uncharacterized protein n=1 Tax=Oppiella nova TaxID=334625 RepID=A0A7R9QN46_9ACAR|nr:unnamed protein product [Oppiella nova]CAG2169156.1 unnamed protein product [Oppiella nova]
MFPFGPIGGESSRVEEYYNWNIFFVVSDMCTFNCKKWTLFTFCLIDLVGTLIMVIALCVVINKADYADQTDHTITKDQFNASKKVAIGLIAAIGTINILIGMLGLCGAFKEHYCMTVTCMCIALMVVVTLGSIGKAAGSGYGAYWFTFVINTLITALACWYAKDLNRRHQESMPKNNVPAQFTI